MDPAPKDTYKTVRAVGWTRVDMVLALLDGAIRRFEQAAERFEHGDVTKAAAHLLRGQRIVLELIAGIDLRYGELPKRLRDLYAYVLRLSTERQPAALADACKLLQTIREGFEGIRAEAEELERRGEIPPPPEDTAALDAVA